MSDEAVHELIRRTRRERGETVSAIAAQIGVREGWLRAIEAGRFSELPTGIYGRYAVRRYSEALGLNADEMLSGCQLPTLEDQVSALGRLRGTQSQATWSLPSFFAAVVASASEPSIPKNAAGATLDTCAPPLPSWRPVAAAAADSVVVVAMLLILIAGTMAVAGAQAANLGHAAAPVFALMGVALAACYFLVVGGVMGATIGERIAAVVIDDNVRRVDMRTAGSRAWRSACHDVDFIELAGTWLGHAVAEKWSSHEHRTQPG